MIGTAGHRAGENKQSLVSTGSLLVVGERGVEPPVPAPPDLWGTDFIEPTCSSKGPLRETQTQPGRRRGTFRRKGGQNLAFEAVRGCVLAREKRKKALEREGRACGAGTANRSMLVEWKAGQGCTGEPRRGSPPSRDGNP